MGSAKKQERHTHWLPGELGWLSCWVSGFSSIGISSSTVGRRRASVNIKEIMQLQSSDEIGTEKGGEIETIKKDE